MDLERLARTMSRQRQAIGDELRKLMESPELYDVAQALTDAMIDELTCLCNFDHAVTHNGEKVEIVEVMGMLETDIKKEFQRLTGRPYVPKICRLIDYKEKGNQT